MKKKALSMTLAVALSLSMGITAFAAPVTMSDGNVFDADYYAQNNPDVVQALGTDANALYSHYVNFGKTEGRLPYAPDSSTTVTQTATATATQGTTEAYLEAGRNALYGLNGTAISVETAYNNFLTAQQLGSVEANFYLGVLYDWYSYPTKDYAIAKAYYEACGDNPNAQISLAILYNDGQGVVQDKTKALSMCQSLVNNGYVDAYYGLAEIAFYNDGDYATALNYFTKVANEGSEPLYIADSTAWIGYIYANGNGVSRDYAKAMEWYLKAANLGSKGAMNNIGAMYEAGEGVSRDYAQAMQWFTKAANLRNATAMNNIGAMYCNGEGVTKDMSKAVEWWQKAAALGEENAINNLRQAGY
jgi:TPR repeat protein